jgi:hypothetical protein
LPPSATDRDGAPSITAIQAAAVLMIDRPSTNKAWLHDTLRDVVAEAKRRVS